MFHACCSKYQTRQIASLLAIVPRPSPVTPLQRRLLLRVLSAGIHCWQGGKERGGETHTVIFGKSCSFSGPVLLMCGLHE